MNNLTKAERATLIASAFIFAIVFLLWLCVSDTITDRVHVGAGNECPPYSTAQRADSRGYCYAG